MTEVAHLAMLELVREMAELEGRIEILATALRDIERIADDYADYDTTALNSILHITRIGGVKTAMGG